MSAIINFLHQCTSWWQKTKYELLSKKDDDLGVEEAKIKKKNL